ncbi:MULTISPECIES: carbohydrate ABC transporter permease [Microcella]|uniref:Carbohydrate ABC transporter permease n=1 Tax=Microcella pacifica TaxID=2591847 RepID=A0A9E5ML13_9MICO|nr:MULTISPECIES: carbohydrate ABC transporter permease [Microcella]NHF63979.1 carbohydrate ABC transporter permease [Microcella pacifica]QOD94028.1 carbohydrate ABC transporter permease [Chryseoglobus sp. 28M-23]
MTTQTAHARTARQRPPRRIMDARWSVLLGIVFVWCLAPFFWLVMTSFKRGDRALNDPDLFQGPFGLDNYIAVLGQGFLLNMRNSLVVATMTTVVCTIIGALAAYAIARLPLKRRVLWLSGVLAASLFPPVSLVPPLYEVWRSIGLLNTWEGLYVSYVSFSLPLTIFILTTFFAAIPSELEEAAKIDGATPLQAFRKVILPLAGPGLFSAAIITFVTSWNEFLLASTFAPRNAEVAQTVPVAIAAFTGAVEFQRPIGTITAASVMVTIPMVILALVLQRRIVSGLTAGAVKG